MKDRPADEETPMTTDTLLETDQVDALVDQLLADYPPDQVKAQEFLGAQFDAGLAWVHFPKGSGGLGLTPSDHQKVISRLAAVGAPTPAWRNVIGYGMVAPTIAAHGTDEQKARYLRPLFT